MRRVADQHLHRLTWQRTQKAELLPQSFHLRRNATLEPPSPLPRIPHRWSLRSVKTGLTRDCLRKLKKTKQRFLIFTLWFFLRRNVAILKAKRKLNDTEKKEFFFVFLLTKVCLFVCAVQNRSLLPTAAPPLSGILRLGLVDRCLSCTDRGKCPKRVS